MKGIVQTLALLLALGITAPPPSTHAQSNCYYSALNGRVCDATWADSFRSDSFTYTPQDRSNGLPGYMNEQRTWTPSSEYSRPPSDMSFSDQLRYERERSRDPWR